MGAFDLILAAVGMMAEALAHFGSDAMSWFSDKVLPLLVDADKWGNAAFGGSSDKQTISAHAWEMEADGRFFGFMRPVLDWFLGDGHCQRAFQAWLTDGSNQK